MKPAILFITLLTAACAPAPPTEVCRDQQAISAVLSNLQPPGGISVCWDDATYTPEDYYSRIVVEVAIRDGWNRALDVPEVPWEDRVRFTGFDKCQGHQEDFDIRISVHDGGDAAYGHLGTGIHRINLNFMNKSETHITRDSLHEFGHALGLAHEHDRADANSCDATGSKKGATYFGDYDQGSIMSYCSGGKYELTSGDIQGIRQAYYPDAFPTICKEL